MSMEFTNEHDVVEEDNCVDEADPIEDGSDTICNQLEQKLSIGCSIKDLEQAYLLYCEYARLTGFSVRKGDQKYYYLTKIVRAKEFKCSCEGRHDDKKSKHTKPAYKRQIQHTDCKAFIEVVKESRAADSKWVVQKFQKQHNHELVPVHQSYLLRSARNMSYSQQAVVEAMKSCGIGVSVACRFLEKQSGGPSNVGFTRKDVYNHLATQNMKTSVPNVDATEVLRFFASQSALEPYFYFNTQLDEDGRLMNFFFRDSRCLIDYEHFGDILSIDTTYKTNRYDLICAPFVGVNHHMKNIMFGLGFLSNESTTSFEWLFQSFLESMYSKQPSVVYSDQSASLIRGIDSTFVNARHRLCQWHINRNASSHFGALNNNNKFKTQWHYCMNGVDDEAEFEHCWNDMINEHSLGEHKWFKNMYKLRKRWASVFTNDIFTAGLLATSRSEATNRVLKSLCSASSTLVVFVKQFMQVITDWREKESVDDFGSIGRPGTMDENSPILSYGSKNLTRSVYKAFENEVGRLSSVTIVQRPVNPHEGGELEFKVMAYGDGEKLRIVHIDSQSNSARCTCRLWVTSGIICRHIFRIFVETNVRRVPTFYFLPRFSKLAKHRHPNFMGMYRNDVGEGLVGHMTFVNYAVKLLLNMTEFANQNSSRRKKIIAGLFNMKKDIMNAAHVEGRRTSKVGNKTGGSNTVNVSAAFGTSPINPNLVPKSAVIHVRDPTRKRRAKPGEKPPLSHWQKKKAKTISNMNPQSPITKWPDVECSQQTLSNFEESASSFMSTHETSGNNDIGEAVWDVYTSLSQNSEDDSLDEPIDISPIFDQGDCSYKLPGGNQFFL